MMSPCVTYCHSCTLPSDPRLLLSSALCSDTFAPMKPQDQDWQQTSRRNWKLDFLPRTDQPLTAWQTIIDGMHCYTYDPGEASVDSNDDDRIENAFREIFNKIQQTSSENFAAVFQAKMSQDYTPNQASARTRPRPYVDVAYKRADRLGDHAISRLEEMLKRKAQFCPNVPRTWRRFRTTGIQYSSHEIDMQLSWLFYYLKSQCQISLYCAWVTNEPMVIQARCVCQMWHPMMFFTGIDFSRYVYFPSISVTPGEFLCQAFFHACLCSFNFVSLFSVCQMHT